MTVKTKTWAIIIVVLVITTGLAALLILMDINKENQNQKPEKITLSLIREKDSLNSRKLKSQTEKEAILTETSKILRDEIHSVTDKKLKGFVLDDFKNVLSIIDFMLAIDSINGHAIYFKGEVYRLLGDYDKFTDYFEMYLSIEDSIGTHLQKVTNPRLCYDTALGYCEKRTAWVSQLLANYYYHKAVDEADIYKRMNLFKIATEHIQNVRTHFSDGFNSSSVTLSTSELETNLKTIISD